MIIPTKFPSNYNKAIPDTQHHLLYFSIILIYLTEKNNTANVCTMKTA